ncbi:PAS domain-containing sensor histidine kinase [Candidatus Nitrosotalea bavarica]|uniref:PAS domain-containing sensor histidine kinase n=1 Tax=Candidatus Nitrosotalea bavarica TaxID=1903277 RepID=UPI0013FDD1E8|nr:PAS domain-containing sensor histidine kinase [Candidatus Nitrosotalea bavarica]
MNKIKPKEKKLEDKIDYRQIYESSPVLQRTIDKDGFIISCNTSYAKKLGYTKKQIIGKSIFDHSAEKSINVLKSELKKWKKTHEISLKEIWLKRKNGKIFPTLLSGASVYDVKGNLIGRTISLIDLTTMYLVRNKMQAKEELVSKQLDELKKLNLIKDEFMAMITHELKTPLAPIKGYADILLSEALGPLNPTQKERLEIIRSSSNSLLKLISDILDSQKIELGQLVLHKEIQSLSQIITESIDRMKPSAERKEIAITTDLMSALFCYCDKIRLQQVLTNLITNALDFIPKQTGTILIKSYKEDGMAKILVKDNGIGIAKSDLEQIFVKFYQVDTKATREHGGTGLGLSVCKGIIDNHGGKIWAESEGKGKGTSVHILLPIEDISIPIRSVR